MAMGNWIGVAVVQSNRRIEVLMMVSPQSVSCWNYSEVKNSIVSIQIHC
jgi:hypothetical protein